MFRKNSYFTQEQLDLPQVQKTNYPPQSLRSKEAKDRWVDNLYDIEQLAQEYGQQDIEDEIRSIRQDMEAA